MIDERERAKRPNETDLQWRQRIEKLDQDERDRSEPVVTAEAERHGDYRDEFVMHLETQTLARTKRNRDLSSLVRMFNNGQLTQEQLLAGETIMLIVERITRGVAISSGKLEARVDCTRGGAEDEHIRLVRDEIAYSRWRTRLPMPRRLVIDMLTLPQPMSATARSYRLSWAKARKRLVDALDEFVRVRDRVEKEITK